MVGPLMIGAHQARRLAVPGGAYSGTAMAAAVVKGAQRAVAIPDHHHGKIADLHRQVTAGIRHLAVVTDEQPVSIPDHVQIDLVILRTGVEASCQCGVGVSPPQSAQHGIALSHDRVLGSRGSSTGDTITNSDSAHCLDATSYNAYTTAPNSRRLRREFMKHLGGRALWIACLLCFGGITAADENPATLQVGTLLLHRCGRGPWY